MTDPWYFVADIGGTNARFSAYHGAKMVEMEVYDTKSGGDLLAMAHSFREKAFPQAPLVAVAAAAGPVKNNALQLTNADRSLCGEDLRAATGARDARIINDFAAAAWSTLAFGSDDLIPLSGDETPTTGTRLVIGPGTGLGVGGLVYSDGAYHGVSGEGGHIGIGPRSRYEVEVFDALRRHWPEIFFGDALAVEAEGLLSGTGLPYLYRAIQDVEGAAGFPLEPRAIFATTREGSDTIAAKTLQMFKSHLAQAAGDLALAYGAHGGVFLVGGIAVKNQWLFDDEFVTAFHAGGRFTKEREALNLFLVKQSDFGLIGARRYVDEILRLDALTD